MTICLTISPVILPSLPITTRGFTAFVFTQSENAVEKATRSTGVKLSPGVPPMVPRIPDIDLISVNTCDFYVLSNLHKSINLSGQSKSLHLLLETIINLDISLFNLINQDLSNSFFDAVMPILRNKYTWLPFYIFIVGFAAINLKWKGAWLIFCLIVAVGVGDTLSSKLIKNSVKRLRPCRTEQLVDDVQVRVHCGSGYSFTSSHATNHFAVAVFLVFAFGQMIPKCKWPLFVWAAAISFAQVYVGVHYPFDVLAGAILGSLIGFAFGKYYLLKARQWFDQKEIPDPLQT
jgi:undecaprenyl-diphosphatase